MKYNYFLMEDPFKNIIPSVPLKTGLTGVNQLPHVGEVLLGDGLVQAAAIGPQHRHCPSGRHHKGLLHLQSKVTIGKQFPSGSNHGLEVDIQLDAQNYRRRTNIYKKEIYLVFFVDL